MPGVCVVVRTQEAIKKSKKGDDDVMTQQFFADLRPPTPIEKKEKQARAQVFSRHFFPFIDCLFLSGSIIFDPSQSFPSSHKYISTQNSPSLPSCSKGQQQQQQLLSCARTRTLLPLPFHPPFLPLYPAIRIPRIVLLFSAPLLTHCRSYLNHLLHTPTTPTKRAQRAWLLLSLRHPNKITGN